MSQKRRLTPFLAHEMLYDYVTGHLDSERKAAIEEFLKSDREGQNLVEAIKRGIAYGQALRSIELSPSIVSELEQSENFVSMSKRMASWSSWPDALRWSIVALAISGCTAGIMVLIPWKNVPLFSMGKDRDENTVEVARLDAKRPNGEDTGAAASADASGIAGEASLNENGATGDQSGDEEFAEESSGQLAIQQGNPALSPQPSVQKSAARPSLPAAPRPTIDAESLASSATTAGEKPSEKGRGFVYRAFMTLSDLEALGPKITQQVIELGAEKAGEVELGWKRGSGRYYHFKIPESNEQKLLEVLRVYGPVRVSKDPHPRQMPEGEVRFILWIESGG